MATLPLTPTDPEASIKEIKEFFQALNQYPQGPSVCEGVASDTHHLRGIASVLGNGINKCYGRLLGGDQEGVRVWRHPLTS